MNSVRGNGARSVLCLFLAAVAVTMVVVSVITSMRSNLFEEFGRLVREPWMAATLIDFYFNILIFSLWACWREARWARGLAWTAAFVLLGSIATSLYVLVRVLRLRPDQPLSAALLRDEP